MLYPSAMNISAYAVIIYGIFVVIGGLIGYLQAKSRASLIAGSISGLLLLLAGIMMLNQNPSGTIFASFVTLSLVGIFGKRFMTKRVFMPAGLMLILSLLMLVVLGMRFFLP